jgi:hypothetical protein
MRTKEQQQQYNRAYLQRQKARGIIITSFMMPAVLFGEVKNFIATRSLQLALSQRVIKK